LRSIVFDFDGVILETEEPELRTWQEIYAEHGETLPVASWVRSVGGSSEEWFDPYADLETRVGRALDRAALRERRQRRHAEIIRDEPPLPGVELYLEQARSRSLGLAVASSSPTSWVSGHLERLGLIAHFDRVVCRDDVERVKPQPDLYLAAVRALGVEPSEAIAIEDSPNGIAAAKSAGLFCVAVPNAVTRDLPLDGADLLVESLAVLPLDELLSLARS
jgi:HAD superfamily hydrolase (TIGR01509 family)